MKKLDLSENPQETRVILREESLELNDSERGKVASQRRVLRVKPKADMNGSAVADIKISSRKNG